VCGTSFATYHWDDVKVAPREETEDTCEIVEWDELAEGDGILVDIDALHDGYVWAWLPGIIWNLTYLWCFDGPSATKRFEVVPGNMLVSIPLADP